MVPLPRDILHVPLQFYPPPFEYKEFDPAQAIEELVKYIDHLEEKIKKHNLV